MAVPVWVPGQVLAAADVNRWFVPDMSVKTADQNVISSTTLVNDTQLFQAVEANATYTFQLMISYLSTACQFKICMSGPSGWSGMSCLLGGGTVAGTTRSMPPATCNYASYGWAVPLMWWGTIITSSTAGTIHFQFAQDVSTATNTTCQAGSFFSLVRSG